MIPPIHIEVSEYIYGKSLSLIVIAGYRKSHLARSNPVTISDLASFTEKGRGKMPPFCPASPDQARGSK